MSSLKSRFATIAALAIVSIISLWPRDFVEARREAGQIVGYDTVKRVPLKLGLDLKGGMYLALTVDESRQVVADKSDALERAIKVVRTRIDQFGVAEPNVQRVGDDRLVVELPGIDDPQRARDIVEKTAFLEFKIVDETRALERVLPRMDAKLKELGIVSGDTATRAQLVDPMKGIGLRADTTDSLQTDSLPPADSGGVLMSRIRAGAIAGGEYLVPADDYQVVDAWLKIPEVKALLPAGKEIAFGTDSSQQGATWYRSLYVVNTRPLLQGQDLIDAQPRQDPSVGTVVEFQLNNVAGRRFRQLTQQHVQDYMAIILDGRVMGRPPVIQEPIGARGQITLYGAKLSEAQDLALVLRAGALPVPLMILEQRDIGPSLGQDSIDQGVRAALIAVVLVIVIIGVYYQFSGLLAIAGLCFYVLMTLGALAALDAVITLPGVAGFVLSIGIAVDANVLIFERIREELNAGKTVRTAVDEGFRHAMSAIIDSNVTTILTAAILYQFGTGPVRGFAVTLIAGVLASMITGIFIVRTFFLAWLSRNRGAQALSI